MKHHLYTGLIAFCLISLFPFLFAYAALGSSKGLGGKIRMIPAPEITKFENMCQPNMQYCLPTGVASPIEASWEYTINERRTFNLIPDNSPIKGNTYYIPDGVRPKSGGVATGRNILGLYNKSTTKIGQCTCTYVTNTPIPITFTVVTPVSTMLAKISLWGTSK